ncbi:MAG: alpha/beta hydrolase [Deltaproteobacteria bacterium]|nr:alpha/beta hydrolase [Deltaproteobacteria bacterium]
MHNTMDSKFRFLSHCRIVGAFSRILLLIACLTACATNKPNEINLMPAPDVYEKGVVDPFTDTHPIEKIPYKGILYVTDRAPASTDNHFYKNKRGNLLRLGAAKIQIGKEGITWEEARRISLLKNRTDKYPIKVTGAEEFGILDRSYSVLTDPGLMETFPHRPAERFAQLVNEKLKGSKKKDVYIYVHGYKVVFENPILVATELWHYLGYEGVFIAFAWPSTPKALAYVSDLETAALSSHNLRIFLEFLAQETDVEQIHIIGYSAGTRLVINALAQLALLHSEQDKASIQRMLRIGQVLLTASDYDRQLFGVHLVDGLLKVPRTLTIYMSESDKALSFSRWLFDRERLGQMWKDRKLSDVVVEYLRKHRELILIDVTNAESAAGGNGHAYFRKSPWVSSDVLMTLMYNLRPDERGLVQSTDITGWTFPPDYIRLLRAALIEAGPEAKESRK